MRCLSRVLSLVLFILASGPALDAQPMLFETREMGILDVHKGLERGDFNCRELVERFLQRIEAYDQPSSHFGGLNAISRTNPKALERADLLDKEFAVDGITKPLHCIPFIVKENYDTHDLPTSGGSASLAGSIPPDDAQQVRRIREEGAIVLAKSHMAEFAFSPYESLSSLGLGHTRNPYDLLRVPAGSSGGTAAAVSASFGVVGLGTDTGNSIRGPSSHTALVGIRSTMGATSRDGIIPLNLFRDIGGPMAKSVTDAVIVFDVIARYDPNDPVTEAIRTRRPDTYRSFLVRNGARGKRIGVVRQLVEEENTHSEILALFEQALEDLEKLGAEIVDPVTIEALDIEGLWCNPFKDQLNTYLASLGEKAKMRSLADIIESGEFHPSIGERLRRAEEITESTELQCAQAAERSKQLTASVDRAFDSERLNALIYPSWSYPPRHLGDLNSPHGNNSPRIAPPTGYPAMTVPMGFAGHLPAGLQILGPAFSEGVLIQIGFAYEQSTLHRRPPPMLGQLTP